MCRLPAYLAHRFRHGGERSRAAPVIDDASGGVPLRGVVGGLEGRAHAPHRREPPAIAAVADQGRGIGLECRDTEHLDGPGKRRRQGDDAAEGMPHEMNRRADFARHGDHARLMFDAAIAEAAGLLRRAVTAEAGSVAAAMSTGQARRPAR